MTNGFRRPLVAAAILASVVACGSNGQPASGGFQMPPLPVETARAVRDTVWERFHSVGTVDADDAVTVVSEIDGTVLSLPFVEGAAVEQGGRIARLEDSQLSAEVARAEALVEQQRATHARVREVVEQGAGSRQDMDDARANLKVAESNLALARSRWNKTIIRAPFAGFLGVRLVSPGAFVRAGQPITSLAKIDLLRVRFSVPERFLSQVRAGAEVSVTTPAYPDRRLAGVVTVVEPVLDADTRTASVIARVPNPDLSVRPGMSANVSVILTERTDALTVNLEAVFANGAQAFVYTISADSTVAMAPVTLGTRMADRVEVTSGLAVAARVVRAGHQKLFPGAKVLPIPEAP